jgi:hypothetical protein
MNVIACATRSSFDSKLRVEAGVGEPGAGHHFRDADTLRAFAANHRCRMI